MGVGAVKIIKLSERKWTGRPRITDGNFKELKLNSLIKKKRQHTNKKVNKLCLNGSSDK